MRYLYSVLFYLAMPWLFLRLLWRSRNNPAYRQRWSERLGYVNQPHARCLWVHAASVGETIAAVPLIKALQQHYPTLPILVTNMTITGHARTRAAFGDSVLQAYIPYDAAFAARRFIRRIKPVVAVIMETELWPNLFAACQHKGIPVIVANARLSAKSAAGYQRVAWLVKPMLDAVTTLAVQTQTEADRFIALGLTPNKAIVTGNLKFDVEVPAALLANAALLRRQLGGERFIWVAGSTHPGEEEIILAAHQQLLTTRPDALLILAPRHPERFTDVSNLVRQQGLHVVRRSQQGHCLPTTNVYLSDTMGELMLMYGVSDVAFVAGSFAAIGGHNMLEAAVLGKPVVTGPQLYNFAEISRSLQTAQGMVIVQNSAELATVLLQLCDDVSLRKNTGDNARRFVENNRGALAKQVRSTAVLIDAQLSTVA